ncbi:MAG: HDOD domain-containing protein [Planctomycetes bacterium]|nr:HDOD domain-containing protein [Planctomycetota bacterium]
MKHLLFVTDNPGLIETIARVRVDRSATWNPERVATVADAKSRLQDGVFDFVFIDVERLGLNGVNLLRDARRQQPRAVRFALTKAFGSPVALQAATVAHQCLALPCTAAALVDVVNRALVVQSNLTSEELRAAVHRLTALPSPPQTFLALSEALADPEVSLDVVSKTISEDPGLATKLMQIVNSSYFGPSRPVSSLRQATTYMGLSRLKQLVLGAEIFGNIGHAGLASEEFLTDRQRHAVLVARLAADVVADPSDSEAAFTVGLLHDVGELVLAGRGYGEGRLAEAELAALHPRVGAYLISIWGLPLQIVEAVLHHHWPSSSGLAEFGVTGAVHVADTLAEMLAATGDQARVDAARRQFDRKWLERTGRLDRIDEWFERAMAMARQDDLLSANAPSTTGV